ncbi:hypothetical protein [Delftia tsuruhatensis]|uniref:hypothetical protein n=1 Tax=Delftia tsuruhatensis TaxID=180282 RepID=UPI0020287B9A|nr:hypothetical protein [Delftia tsuruhatensis]
MPMKCMAQMPAPRQKAPVSTPTRRMRGDAASRASPAICMAITDVATATSTDSVTRPGCSHWNHCGCGAQPSTKIWSQLMARPRHGTRPQHATAGHR